LRRGRRLRRQCGRLSRLHHRRANSLARQRRRLHDPPVALVLLLPAGCQRNDDQQQAETGGPAARIQRGLRHQELARTRKLIELWNGSQIEGRILNASNCTPARHKQETEKNDKTAHAILPFPISLLARPLKPLNCQIRQASTKANGTPPALAPGEARATKRCRPQQKSSSRPFAG
jgi:hypothetical protein